MTITLIGMPAVGKSCMGRALSKKFNMKTVDGDKLIEQATGRKLQQIIDEDGLDAFKKLEEETLLSIKEDNIIITPGGSAIYYPEVMKHFKESGIVVYLYASPKVIIERLGDFSRRGVVLKPGQTIMDLYAEREPLLNKYADITVSCNGKAFSKYRADAYEKIQNWIEKSGQ
ncbi:MAG: shikimate kinase [Clostridia bacterium]|nr:shikimate kinase [Clostridia bacterium]